jgi:hypothetical protein
MHSHTRESDRRNALRFEVIGFMRATAMVDVPVTVRNVGPGGVLVEAPWPLAEKSVHAVRVQQGVTFATLDARVCHVRRADGASTYLIGLEFLGDPSTLDTCTGLLSANESLA